MIGGMVVVGFCCFIGGIILKSCIDYRKDIKIDINREKCYPISSREVSFSEVAQWVKDFYSEPTEDIPMDELFLKWLEEKDEKPSLLAQSDGYVEVEQPCSGNDCACSPANEDCCPGDYNNGKCKIVININKLCNVEDTVTKDPNLVTPVEAEQFARMLTLYLEKQNKNN